MRIPARLTIPARLRRTLVVLGFAALCAVLFGWLWASGGGRIPGITHAPKYTVAFRDSNVLNLAHFGDVQVAGVRVGRVQDLTADRNSARVVIGLDPVSAPLHRGATVRVGIRSLEGPSYVEVVDGNGPPIPAGSTLPDTAVKPSVDLRAVLASLDPKTRAKLGATLRSLGAGTRGTQQSVAQVMSALGVIGRQGYTAVDAIAAQSEDLRQLAAQTTALLDALDTGQGQIADAVRNAQRLTAATAGQRQAVEATVKNLPGVVGSARTAAGKLTTLSGSLAPVAANLNRAAPDLDHALLQLPATTADLRGLLPALDGTLGEAPATLNRVPTLGDDVTALVPKAQFELRDLNPMLAYLSPYGHDVAAFFTNFGAAFSSTDENGYNFMRLMPVFNEQSLKGYPIETSNLGPLTKTNAYPAPGQSGNLAPLAGPPPHLERDPR